MRAAGDSPEGLRLRGVIVVLWRAGQRVSEALALPESDLDRGRGAVSVRCGHGGRRREVSMDRWVPDTLKLKEAELTAEQHRLSNFVGFVGEGRGSRALAKALFEAERRVDQLADDVDALRRSREKIFRPPPIEWRGPPGESPAGARVGRCTLGATLRNLVGPSGLSSSRPTSAPRPRARSRPWTRSPS